jgi:hypothetical protein
MAAVAAQRDHAAVAAVIDSLSGATGCTLRLERRNRTRRRARVRDLLLAILGVVLGST